MSRPSPTAGSGMIEFYFWQGCPSHERALAQLTAEMEANGLEPEHLRVTELFTEADAQRERFVGSPTIRIDGNDVADPGDEPAGLNCRLYRRRDGRPSPLPDPEDLAEAVRAYAQASSAQRSAHHEGDQA